MRSLARLADLAAPEPADSLAQAVSRWLGWADAIALAAALDGRGGSEAAGAAVSSAAALLEEAARLRRTLELLIRPAAGAPAPGPVQADRRGGVPATRSPEEDLHALVAHGRSAQQSMQRRIGELRERVRAALAEAGGEGARLAAIDTVLARVVGEREQFLLGGLPRWLELREARLAAAASGAAQDRARLARELTEALLAELDHRWQPVEGLLQALRPKPPRLP